MSQTLALHGTTFALVGTFYHLQEDLKARIEAGGGKVQQSFSASVDVLVAGHGARDIPTRARYQGVMVIDELVLRRLLAGEEIPIQYQRPEVFDEDTLLEELRGLLNTPRALLTWAQLVRLLDRCDPALLDAAVHYASAYLDRLDTAACGPLREVHDCDAQRGIPRHERLEGTNAWHEALPHLMRWRPAPQHWIGQLSRGARSPKFKLINGLYFHGSKLSATQTAATLSNPALTGVRELGLGGQCRYGKNTFKALRANEALHQLTSLTLDHDAQGIQHASLLAEQDALPALARLDLQNVRLTTEDSPLIALACSPWAARVGTLGLRLIGLADADAPGAAIQRRLARDLTPHAARLLLDVGLKNDMQRRAPLSQGWRAALLPTMARVEVFGMFGDATPGELGSYTLASSSRFSEFESLRALDLSELSMISTRIDAKRRHKPIDPDVAETATWRAIASTGLTQRAGSVWLGAHQQHIVPIFRAAEVEVITAPLPCLLA